MSSAPGRRVNEVSEEAAARPPAETDDLDAVTDGDAFAGVRDALAALAARLDREHERAAHREAVIDRLHEENERLRRGELQTALEPLRAALYRLHDQARREARRWSEPDPPEPAHAAALLAAVADEIADALARSGVERYTVEPGEPFDAVRHRPVAVERVTDPALAGTVLWARSDGFEQGGRVVRKAEVCVAKPAGPAEGPATDPAADRTADHTADRTADAAADPAPDAATAAGTATGPDPAAGTDPTSGQSHPREAGRSETMSSTASATPPSASSARRATVSGVPGPGSDR
ncbi:nucleotide exchange factor GrpE [Actinomadura miaoliensis]|uniref:Nucleotide exchange factor GrpE n=1 Tax=Actinomadura miaoliensis TaxID=430685 RepID=A0ABP7V401_9ACTN